MHTLRNSCMQMYSAYAMKHIRRNQKQKREVQHNKQPPYFTNSLFIFIYVYICIYKAHAHTHTHTHTDLLSWYVKTFLDTNIFLLTNKNPGTG